MYWHLLHHPLERARLLAGDVGERIIIVLNFGLHESFFDAILIMVLTRVMDVQ